MSAILGCIFSHSRSIYCKNFPNPPRTLAPAARAKNAFGVLFSPPNRKSAAPSLRQSPKFHRQASLLSNYFPAYERR